jgi:EAL domain-containing protein (putative c-di-GMP-specific phosphodiesterase class I)
MSVDISAHHLMSAGFTDSIAHLLRSTDDPPGLLILEITESTFLQDSERALLVLNDLKDLGIKLALDDFGIGYSSLSYLKRFPVDIIKIDRSFIADLDHNAASHTIVDAVVGLAHGLAMTVVAEGVETEEQLDRITGIGCDKCQGLFLARPTPVEGIPALIGPTREPVAVSR